MSTETVETVQQSGDELLVRSFEATLSEGNGRTLEGLCVPYNTPAIVNDGQGPYTEVFVKGAFARAVKAPNRVWLNFEHAPGIANVIGSGVAFEERDDGLYGTLEIDDGSDGDKARRLYHKRALTALSVEFKPMTKPKMVDGVVQRTSVHLDAVALCRVGAYPEAQVLAVRAAVIVDETELPMLFDPGLAQGLSRWLEVPDALRVSEDG